MDLGMAAFISAHGAIVTPTTEQPADDVKNSVLRWLCLLVTPVNVSHCFLQRNQMYSNDQTGVARTACSVADLRKILADKNAELL